MAAALTDAHVGKHIFEQCILDKLSKKARLFVTNQNHFLPFATHIVVMKGGQMLQQGTYDELVAAGVDFASLVEEKKAAADDAAAADGEETKVEELSSEALVSSSSAQLLAKAMATKVRRVSSTDGLGQQVRRLICAVVAHNNGMAEPLWDVQCWSVIT